MGGNKGRQEKDCLQMMEAARSLSPIASDGQVRMISCGADKSIYFRTAQKVRPLGVPDRAGVGMGFQVTRGEERQSKLCDLVMHLVVCPRAPYCSLEKEYSLLGRTTWYGRQPSMTWMWSLAGSTRPSAAKTEIFGGHSLLRLFKNAFLIYFVWGGREGMCMYHGEHVDIRGLFSGLVSLLL